MKKENNDSLELRQMFQNTFDPYKASDEMKNKIKDNIKIQMESDKQKKHHVVRFSRVAAIAACFLLIICAVNYNSIKAGVGSLYEYFFRSVETKYDHDLKDYSIDIQKKVLLEDDCYLEIKEAAFKDHGVDFKLKLIDDANRFELVGYEITLKEKKQVYDFYTEMFVNTGEYYLASLIFANKEMWKDFKNKEFTFDATVLYIDRSKDDGELLEKHTTLTLTPKYIYHTKSCKMKNQKIYNDGFYKIELIELNSWYMKVICQELKNKDSNKFRFLNIATEKEDLLFLGGSNCGTVEDNDVVETDNTAEMIYQIPEKEPDYLYIRTFEIDFKEMEQNQEKIGDDPLDLENFEKNLTQDKKVPMIWE